MTDEVPDLDPGQDPDVDVDAAEMDDAELTRVLEALLLVVETPVSDQTLATVTGQPPGRITEKLEAMAAELTARDSGIDLREAGGGWRMYTRAHYAPYVERLLLDGSRSKLTRAALETLAVVACKEPVTRVEIEKIRGVTAGRVLGLLMEKGLIEERGRLDIPGRPILYGTTKRFLACTGLSDVNELRMRWREGLEEGELF